MEGHYTVPKFHPFGEPLTLGPRWTRGLSGFEPKVNNALARHVFHGIHPAAGETIQQFATRLRKAALDRAYGAETDNNIRDAIFCKCPSIYIKRRLLEEGDELTLVRTLTLAAQCEKSKLK